MPVRQAVELRVFHEQQLKSSLFSAKIEGNKLNIDQIQDLATNSRSTQKREIANLANSLMFLPRLKLPLTKKKILLLHSKVLVGLDYWVRGFRTEQTAIFDASGNVVYLTPPVLDMEQMLHTWISEFNRVKSQNEWLTLLGPLHYYFEKIHPFIDGNGRVGRLFLHLAMKVCDIEKKMILPIDQYFEQNRSRYYDLLEKNSSDCLEFSLFLLDGVLWSFDQIFADISRLSSQEELTSTLLPRRQEILAILRDHPSCTMDFLARRFLAVSRRTLANDLSYLLRKNLIRKVGVTRGVIYEIVDATHFA